jgi:hypothetical protein
MKRMVEGTLARRRRTGRFVIAALAMLTVLEYLVGVLATGNIQLAGLAAAAVVKAALIIDYFMHFHQLWSHIQRVWIAAVYGDGDEEATG